MYGYLGELAVNLKAFSIGQFIDEDRRMCDFTKVFGPIEGSSAIDCDKRFTGLNPGMISAIDIKQAEACELNDG